MKRTLTTLASAAALLLAAGCGADTDNNGTLSWDSLKVNFSAETRVTEFSGGEVIGVISRCTRNGRQDVSMSESPISRFRIAGEVGSASVNDETISSATLVPEEGSAVTALSSDHNFTFYGICPCPEAGFEIESMPMSVPEEQSYEAGINSYMTLVARKKVSNILPTVGFDFSTFFSVARLIVASEVAEGLGNLRSVTFAPADEDLFSGSLSVEGTCDLEAMAFHPGLSSSSSVTLAFGGDGHAFTGDYETFNLLVNPFTVPEGGMTVTLTDTQGNTRTAEVLASSEGTSLESAKVMAIRVEMENDGIVPVTFPVVFPLGYPDGKVENGKGYNTFTTLPEWGPATGATKVFYPDNNGIWPCRTQPQAKTHWRWSDAWETQWETFGLKPFREMVNSANAATQLSTPGIKGIWTGDYFEFTLPVKKFRAGTAVTFSMPICCKNAPTFWEVAYLDGDVWKSTARDDLEAYPGSSVKRRATWALPFQVSPMNSVTMVFSNEVKSGELKIRLVCVDGSIISNAANSVKTVERPLVNSAGTEYSGNFYFGEYKSEGGAFKSYSEITFSIN